MTSVREETASLESDAWEGNALVWLKVGLLIYGVLIAVGLIGAGFKLASGGQAKQLFEFATNPFTGLIIGTMATALIQSSSTVTSIIVGLVAGGLPVATAIPMVMGANIGTTITNTLVSLGHVGNKEEFRKAFSAATIHDFFNLFSVVIFLPLEMAFGLLEKLSAWLLSIVQMNGVSLGMGGFNILMMITKPVVSGVQSTLGFLPGLVGGVILVVLGIALIILSITYMGKLLRRVMVGRAKEYLNAAIGKGPLSGIVSGTLVTIVVQSSSTTTSLAVPLAGSGLYSTRQIYPFTLGANIGTCITALLAATSISGPTAHLALQIAMIHLLYNLLGVIVIYGIGVLREIPLACAERLAVLAENNKVLAVIYILATFFMIPGALIALTS